MHPSRMNVTNGFLYSNYFLNYMKDNYLMQLITLRITSLVAQTVKRLPTMREIWVQSLGQEDPLEKDMAIHSSTLAWKTPWTDEPGSYSPQGRKESDTTERLHFTS